MESTKCMSEEELELVCMEVISNAGEGRAHVYTALDLYLGGEREKAKKDLETADGYLQAAHDAQFTKLMAYQLEGGEIKFQLIILHAMDLLMVASAERDMLKHVVMASIKE